MQQHSVYLPSPFVLLPYAHMFFSISMTHDKFAVLDQKHCCSVWSSGLAKAVHESWRVPAATRSGINGLGLHQTQRDRQGTGVRHKLSPISSKPASSYRIKTSHFYGY